MPGQGGAEGACEASWESLLGWPADRRALITTLGSGAGAHSFEPRRVELLGTGGVLAWDRDDRGLHVRRPEVAPGQPAHRLRISR